MASDYSLADLAQLADVTPRTIRYYVAQGLLPSPGQVGPGTRYSDGHLARLRLIRRLQRDHLPLAEIRARLLPLDDAEIAHLVEADPAEPAPPTTALEYVRGVLRGAPGSTVMPANLAAMTARSMPATVSPARALRIAAPAAPAPPATPVSGAAAAPVAEADEAGASLPAPGSPEAPAGPLRSQWERIALGPDVEIHVRRPLGRLDIRRVERLLAFARQLFEGDQS